MKSLYKSLGFAIVAILLNSCESDLEKSFYTDSTAKPAVLEAIQESYKINKLDLDAEAVTFKWTPANVGYQASITNNIEMDIKGENNFSDKKVVLYSNAGKTTELSLTNKELNDQIYTLLKNYANEDGTINIAEAPLQFRIVSSISSVKSPLVSNVIESNITPYNNDAAGYQAAVILNTGINELVLNNSKKDETILQLDWQQAYMGDNASITYKVEINLPSDAPAYNTLKKVTVGTVKNTNSIQISHQSMNNAIISLYNNYKMPVENDGTNIELFITSTKSNYIVALVSDKIALKVKPYSYNQTVNVEKGEESYKLTWNGTEGAKYIVEMDTEENFSQRAVITSGLESTEYTISNEELNKAVKYLKMAHEVSTLSSNVTLYFRVKTYFGGLETNTVSGNAIVEFEYNDVTVNPEILYFIGAYDLCSWSFDNAQKLYKQENGSYKAQIIAKGLNGGWKITNGTDWNNNNNWGKPINNGIMTDKNSGAQDVTDYGYDGNTSYLVTFNPNDGRLSMENEEKSWKLLGDFNGYSSYASDMIIRFDDVEKEWYLTTEKVVEEEKVNYVEMKAGDEWLIRSQIRSLEVLPSNTEGHYEASNNNKFTVSESGKYEIRWYFNKPTQYVVVIKR